MDLWHLKIKYMFSLTFQKCEIIIILLVLNIHYIKMSTMWYCIAFCKRIYIWFLWNSKLQTIIICRKLNIFVIFWTNSFPSLLDIFIFYFWNWHKNAVLGHMNIHEEIQDICRHWPTKMYLNYFAMPGKDLVNLRFFSLHNYAKFT